MKPHDKDKTFKYIMNEDANVLYWWKMKKNLLFRRFKWLTQDELDKSNKNKASKIVQKVISIRSWSWISWLIVRFTKRLSFRSWTDWI